jgi:hypothetical protein
MFIRGDIYIGALSFRDWKGTMAEQIQCAVLRSVRSVRTMEVPKFTLKEITRGSSMNIFLYLCCRKNRRADLRKVMKLAESKSSETNPYNAVLRLGGQVRFLMRIRRCSKWKKTIQWQRQRQRKRDLG